MKRIDLTKFGFVRCPEEDFSDDGNRFTCYKAGKGVRVSKLVSHGDVYLSASSDCGRNTLPHEIYSTLPHYNDALWKYNGVSLAGLTEQDLKDFYDICIAYENEYLEAESTVVYPTLEELTAQHCKVRAKRLEELKEVEALLTKHLSELLLNMSEYSWRTVKSYYTDLYNKVFKYVPGEAAERMLNTAQSLTFCSPDCSMLGPSVYYGLILDYIHRVIG
jgi:hypothetical protein